MTSYTDRYRSIAEQAAYQRKVQAHGLSALLAPYSIRTARLPQQRRTVPTNPAFHAV